MSKDTVTVAAVQALPREYIMHPDNVPHARDLLMEASRLGADLACFPEAYPGTGEDIIRQAARDARIFTVAGFIQKEKDKMYNECVLIDRQGEVAGRQRKVHPVPGLEPFARGSAFQPMETPFGKIGILICIDGWGFPEGFYHLSLAGVDVIFNPCLIFKKKPQKRIGLLSRVFDYKIPIVAPNNAAWPLKIFAEDPGNLPAEGGQSLIISPPPFQTEKDIDAFTRQEPSCEGWIVAEGGREEEILVAELNLQALRKTRSLWAGCYGACLM